MRVAISPEQTARSQERAAFLASTAFASAGVIPLGSDASIRQYFRLEGGPQPALLMDAPSAALEPPCPPDADEDERRRLGYGALVRGSGNALAAYEAAGRVLAQQGLLVPRMLACDAPAGFAIVEDLGTVRVADAAPTKIREAALYHKAADALDRLRLQPASPGALSGWWFQTYDTLAYQVEAELLATWYLPMQSGRVLSDGERARLGEAWGEALKQLSPPRHWCHRDFHADNLMVVDDQLGVLDFQDLMVGQAAYDWASLIEDARRDVDPQLADDLYQRGVEGALDRDAFERDYAILAAQRNAKILGLFARLAARDGKPRYLELLPRVEAFFRADLKRPQLAPVAEALRGFSTDLVP